jgi:hypothetical protein
MASYSSASQKFIDILRKTVWEIDQGYQVHPDDPAIRELRRTLLLKIANLEANQSPVIASQAHVQPLVEVI